MAVSSPAFPPNSSEDYPAPLAPSDLGTKEYWDCHYATGIQSCAAEDEEGTALQDPLDLETWFDDVHAPTKILKFLTSERFPLSPNFTSTVASPGSTKTGLPGDKDPASVDQVSYASVLDLGTGNGSTLFTLRLQGSYHGFMVGVDYSARSIELARNLGKQYASPACTVGLSVPLPAAEFGCDKICFEILDLINDDPKAQEWWPQMSSSKVGKVGLEDGDDGFDLVLDKGTFDAISLSSDTVNVLVDEPRLGQPQTKPVRIYERYPHIAISLVKPKGFLLITSCNWTQDEVIRWFTTGKGIAGELEVFDTIAYPSFQFGGQKGQGVASVCFQRRGRIT